MPRRSAPEDGDRVAADGGFDANVVEKAGWDPGSAVLADLGDIGLEGLEMTLEILGDTDAAARIAESLAALGRGEPGADMATVRQDLARRRVTGA